MEHVDCFREGFGVEIASRPIGSDKITGPIDNALVKLGMLEYYRSEEVNGDLAERLVSWKEVGAVKIAEDPV